VLIPEIVNIAQAVLFSREPISAAEIDTRTGYGRANIDDVLMTLQAAGHVELAECTERVARWRMTERWADARPWPVGRGAR
jgi:DNA-binding transcriptional regulator GbsR (MarR family)